MTNQFTIGGNLFQDKLITVGQIATVDHTFSQDDVNIFANLCGDDNPLHINPEYAKTTMFQGTIVHGIFVSSLLSTILGKSIPGSVYVSQNLSFNRPVHVGVKVTARVEVLEINKSRKGDLITMKTQIYLENGKLAVNGDAKVLLMT
jgi:acyl dehydratase